MVGFTFCPQGWAEANGQLLPISQNTALFSLFGTTYGGDGMTTFALPDLRGRVPIHAGAGPGLTPRNLGSRSGTEAVTLSESQMPSHTHTVNAYSVEGDSAAPTGNIPAKSGAGDPDYSSSAPDTTMNAGTVSNTGGGQSHDNMPPFLTIRFCVALQGLCAVSMQEALRLGWEQVDQSAGTVIIEGEVKNDYRVRCIPVPQVVRWLIQQYGWKGDTVLQPYSDSYRHYSDAVRKSLLAWNPEVQITPKDLRNSLQTEAIDSGWYGFYVKRYVGHAPESTGERSRLRPLRSGR